jgi:hypothetical protein
MAVNTKIIRSLYFLDLNFSANIVLTSEYYIRGGGDWVLGGVGGYEKE